jgi:spore coat polysaccharide biosynthesis protein SpsF (cytidylyltransferase family)
MGMRGFDHDFEFVLGNVRFGYTAGNNYIETVDYKSDFELLEAIKNHIVPNDMRLREYRTVQF